MVQTISTKPIHSLFNQIAHRYDLLNRMLSFGLDQVWRRKVITFVPQEPNLKVLDCATGTADLALMMAQQARNITQVVGVDIATDMLKIGREKVERAGFTGCVELQAGDAHHLAFADASFDLVTVAFGLRNMPGREQALSEMKRVLKPGGRLIVLEFSMPRNWLIRKGYLVYFRHILPRIGGLISGDYKAYQYLNQSVENFDASVLSNFSAHPLSMGIATLYVSDSVA
ncbi:MAG: bifunctional demethylmenaquinone methyltransferase/2-methoxy-6-polyprenyl-1,4-benzoquinol methylase UbiE [Myxococcota bacterium]